MSTEQIRVLHDDGSPTDRVVDRSKIHELGLWHASVHVWLVNQKREILLQKRSTAKSQYANVLHISAAGHVPEGATPLQTAITEVREELGITFSPVDLIFLGVFHVSQTVPETGQLDKEHLYVYLLLADIDLEELELQEEEVGSVKFYPLSLLRKDIQDLSKSQEYLNHPTNYYVDVIDLIEKIDAAVTPA